MQLSHYLFLIQTIPVTADSTDGMELINLNIQQEREEEERAMEKEREAQRRKIIEEERQRLLKQHATKLLGYLPKVRTPHHSTQRLTSHVSYVIRLGSGASYRQSRRLRRGLQNHNIPYMPVHGQQKTSLIGCCWIVTHLQLNRLLNVCVTNVSFMCWRKRLNRHAKKHSS